MSHPLPNRLSLMVLEIDPDYLRLEIIMADGAFGGRVDVYEQPDLPDVLAVLLRGFPVSPADQREVTLGSFDPSHAGGGIRLVFRCTDRAGHAIVDAELEDSPSDGGPVRSVRLAMTVEPSAIDTFVGQLSGWTPAVGERRSLLGTPSDGD